MHTVPLRVKIPEQYGIMHFRLFDGLQNVSDGRLHIVATEP